MQTYRADFWPIPALPAGQVGGAAPSAQDSGAKSSSGDLDDVAVEQSVTRDEPPSGATSVSGIDFGFNFDTVVNTNDAGQGSLRQFVLHANALQNAGLDQSDTVAPIPAGVEAAVFMIPGPGIHTIALPGKPDHRLPHRARRAARGVDGASCPVHERVGVVVERSMWWPNVPGRHPFWTEGHLSTGARQPASRWLFAAQTLDPDTDMYLRLGNFSTTGGPVRVTATFDDGTTSARILEIPPRSRTTMRVDDLAQGIDQRSVRLDVESVGASLALVAERAIYRTRNGEVWGSGSVTMGARADR